MFDSRGGQGGSSSVLTVLPSDDNTCLGPSSPSSTSLLPTSTGRTAPSSPSPTSTSTPSVPTGVVIGVVLGGLILLAAFISLGLFILRRLARRKEQQQEYGDSRVSQRFSLHTRYQSEFDMPPPPPGPLVGQHPYSGHSFSPDTVSTQHLLQEQYMPTPYILSPPSQAYSAYSGASVSDPSELGATGTSVSGSQRKAAMAGANKDSAPPPRFIVHTDVEEIGPNQDGVIELPPQYSATRAPLQQNVFTPSQPQQNQPPGPYPPY